MIGISECQRDIGSVLQEHAQFVGWQVSLNLECYKKIFELIRISPAKKITNREFSKVAQKIIRDNVLSNYKILLNDLLLPGKKIKNKSDIYKIRNVKNWSLDKYCEITKAITLLNKLSKNVEKIITIDITNEKQFKSYERLKASCKDISMLFENIFSYKWFSELPLHASWGPYQFTKAIDLNTCPYCNRQYVFTVIKVGGKKVSRPQLDHFFPQKKHPLLSVSFFNLIPSCSICNTSIKGAANITHGSLLNPYLTNSDHSLFKFTYYPKDYEALIGKNDNLEIKIDYAGKASDKSLKRKVNGSIDLLCLNEVYANHSDLVQELILKRQIYSDYYLKLTNAAFKKLNLTESEAYRIAFSNYSFSKDIHRRPLAKMTRDIAQELGVSNIFKEKKD